MAAVIRHVEAQFTLRRLAVLVQRCQTCSEFVVLAFRLSFLGSRIGRSACLA